MVTPSFTQGSPSRGSHRAAGVSDSGAFDEILSRIAHTLEETDETALKTIRCLLVNWGVADVEIFVQRALEVNAQGGLLTRKKTPRTLGGIFFRLARNEARKRRHAWRFVALGSTGQQLSTPPRPKLTWQAIPGHIKKALELPFGEAANMKITLVAKPGAVVPYGETAFLVMLESAKSPAVPKGLPEITHATKYAVFVSAKQWRKVESVVTTPGDWLTVEGVPTYHESFAGITVLATSVKSKKLEAAKRAART